MIRAGPSTLTNHILAQTFFFLLSLVFDVDGGGLIA
jgi:hypothetical protein